MGAVFKPFFTTKTRGLGVGLTPARRIVERFGGEISLASEPGKGTMATVRLKVAT
jgi:two-component system, NtrC family, sensor histidine kinase HydH